MKWRHTHVNTNTNTHTHTLSLSLTHTLSLSSLSDHSTQKVSEMSGGGGGETMRAMEGRSVTEQPSSKDIVRTRSDDSNGRTAGTCFKWCGLTFFRVKVSPGVKPAPGVCTRPATRRPLMVANSFRKITGSTQLLCYVRHRCYVKIETTDLTYHTYKPKIALLEVHGQEEFRRAQQEH